MLVLLPEILAILVALSGWSVALVLSLTKYRCMLGIHYWKKLDKKIAGCDKFCPKCGKRK